MLTPTPGARLLQESLGLGARTVHLQPQAGGRLLVRLRADRGLVAGPVPPLDGDEARAVVDDLKRLAGLTLEERHLPQEGGFFLEAAPPADGARGATRARVATLPTTHGEAVIVEVTVAPTPPGLAALGLDPCGLERLRGALDAPGGLILAAGPGGSGKRTLLHACLRQLALDTTRTIFSVPADLPVDVPGVVALRPSPELEITDRPLLRFLLRVGDADAVHTAELHDQELSGLALDAAARGLLVLAPTVAGDAAGAVARLLDQGNAPYLVAAGLSLVVGCRVLPRLCGACKVPGPAPDAADLRRLVPRLVEEELLGAWDDAFAPRRGGCAECGGTGHRGRLGIYEVLDHAGARLDAAERDGSGPPLRAYDEVRALREVALLQAAAGEVSLIDALRNTPPAPGAATPRAAL